MFLPIYERKLLRNSSKWCVKISLANEMVVLVKSKSSFYWMKSNLTDRKKQSKNLQRCILSISKQCNGCSYVKSNSKLVPKIFRDIFISTDDHENFLVCRDYCAAAHEPDFCFLKNTTFLSLQTRI